METDLMLKAKFSNIITTPEDISLDDFKRTLPVVINDIKELFRYKYVTHAAFTRLESAINYNVPYITELRGYMVANTFSEIHKDKLTFKQLVDCYILGWCMQIFQTAIYFMTDDHLDKDVSRWGKSTWWLINKDDRFVVNDLFQMVHCVYSVMKYYLGNHPRYTEMLEFMHDCVFHYTIGQYMDCRMTSKEDPNFDSFTLETRTAKWELINGKFIALIPHKMAMLLANIPGDEPIWGIIEEFAGHVAELCTFADDYADSFSSESDHPDVKQGKLTFMILRARELCSNTEWEELKECYGSEDENNVRKVLQMYRKLGLDEWGKTHTKKLEKRIYKNLEEKMSQTQFPIKRSLYSYRQMLFGNEGEFLY